MMTLPAYLFYKGIEIHGFTADVTLMICAAPFFGMRAALHEAFSHWRLMRAIFLAYDIAADFEAQRRAHAYAIRRRRRRRRWIIAFIMMSALIADTRRCSWRHFSAAPPHGPMILHDLAFDAARRARRNICRALLRKKHAYSLATISVLQGHHTMRRSGHAMRCRRQAYYAIYRSISHAAAFLR